MFFVTCNLWVINGYKQLGFLPNTRWNCSWSPFYWSFFTYRTPPLSPGLSCLPGVSYLSYCYFSSSWAIPLHTESIRAAFGNIKAVLKMLSIPSFLGLRIVQSGPCMLPSLRASAGDFGRQSPHRCPELFQRHSLGTLSPVNLLPRPMSHPCFVLWPPALHSLLRDVWGGIILPVWESTVD